MDSWEEYVRPHLDELIQGLKLNEILDALFSKRIITHYDVQKIRGKKEVPFEQNRILFYDCLMGRHNMEDVYRNFVSVLNESKCESCKGFASLISTKKQEGMQTTMGAGTQMTNKAPARIRRPEFGSPKDDDLSYSSYLSNGRERKKTAADQLLKTFKATDLTRSAQAQQDVASPRKTEVALAQPPEGFLNRDAVTVFVPHGYSEESLLIEDSLEKLFRIHLKTNFYLKLLNPDDSVKLENSLTIRSDSVVCVKITLIGMPALEFGKKSGSSLRLLLSIFPKFRNKLRRVGSDSDWEEYSAQIFCKDIKFLVEFFDDKNLQQTFAACLQYQFSALKEIRFTIDRLPCWTLDVGEASQHHNDFPQEAGQRIDAFALVAAVKSNKPFLLRALLEMGADPDAVHKGGFYNWGIECESTALHYACLIGNKVGVDVLIEFRADVNMKNSLGASPLILGAYKGSLPIVKSLILAGANVFYKVKSSSTVLVELSPSVSFDANGCNAFHMACLSGNIFLVEQIGDYFLGDVDTGRTATGCFGALGGNVAVLKYLQENGCSFSKLNDFGNNCLHCCCINGKVRAAAFLYYEGLIQDIDETGQHGLSPLCHAAKENQTNLFAFLLAKGADFERADEHGNTSLMFASNNGNLEILKLLCERGCDVNKQNKDLLTALHCACLEGQSKAASALLKNGAGVEITDVGDWTAFLCACASGSIDTLIVLREAKCTMNTTDKDRKSGLHVRALVSDSEECVFWLLKHADIDVNLRERVNYGQTALHYACRNGHSKVASALLEGGAEVEIRNENDWTAFLCACASGDLNTLIVLRKAKCEMTTTNKYGDSGLHLCALFSNSKKCVFWLLKYAGVGVNSLGSHRRTALHYACRFGNSNVASALLEKGAKIEISDEIGWTAFLCACASGDLDTLTVLSKANCRMTATDKDGNTGLHVCAFFSNSEDCFDWLLERAGIDNLPSVDGPLACSKSHSKDSSALPEGGADVSISDKNLVSVLARDRKRRNSYSLINVANKSGDTVLHCCARRWWKENSLAIPKIFLQRLSPLILLNNNGRKPSQEAFGSVRRVLCEIEKKQHLPKCAVLAASEPCFFTLSAFGSVKGGRKALFDMLKKRESKPDEKWVYCDTGSDRQSLKMFSLKLNFLHALLLVVEKSENYSKMLEEAKQWLSTAKSFLSLSNLCSEQVIVQLVVHSSSKETLGEEKQLMKLAEDLQRLYSAQFSVCDDVIILNCFDPHPEDMASLLGTLKRFEKDRCRKICCQVPVLVNTFANEIVSHINSVSTWPTVSMILDILGKQLDLTVSDCQIMLELLEELDMVTTVRTASSHFVLTPFLVYSKIIDPILNGLMEGEAKMRATKLQALLDLQDKESAITLCTTLNLCHRVAGDDETVLFPALLTSTRPPDLWQDGPSYKIYIGRRLECADIEEIFNPSVFSCFQNRYAQSAVMWNNGLFLENSEECCQVECLVELKDNGHFIDVIVRGSDESEQCCWRTLRELRDQVMTVVDTKSPGSCVVKHYLSRTELEARVDTPVAHNFKRVKEIISGRPTEVDFELKTKNSHGNDVTDSLRDLVIFPLFHINRLPVVLYKRLCDSLDEEQLWLNVAEKLGLAVQTLENIEAEASGHAKQMLTVWGRSLMAFADTELGEVLKELGQDEIVEKCQLFSMF